MAEQYAYGQNEVDGCVCPAVQAGFKPSGDVIQVAEWYDTLVRNQTGLEQGVISEEMAEQKWQEAIQHYKDESEEMYGDYESGIYNDIVSAGERVSDELF